MGEGERERERRRERGGGGAAGEGEAEGLLRGGSGAVPVHAFLVPSTRWTTTTNGFPGTPLHRTVLHSTVLSCSAFHSAAQYCTAFHSTAKCCTVLECCAVLNSTLRLTHVRCSTQHTNQLYSTHQHLPSENACADIWNSTEDVLASMANYLKRNGFQRGQPLGYRVTLPAGFDPQADPPLTPSKGQRHMPLEAWISQHGVVLYSDTEPGSVTVSGRVREGPGYSDERPTSVNGGASEGAGYSDAAMEGRGASAVAFAGSGAGVPLSSTPMRLVGAVTTNSDVQYSTLFSALQYCEVRTVQYSAVHSTLHTSVQLCALLVDTPLLRCNDPAALFLVCRWPPTAQPDCASWHPAISKLY